MRSRHTVIPCKTNTVAHTGITVPLGAVSCEKEGSIRRIGTLIVGEYVDAGSTRRYMLHAGIKSGQVAITAKQKIACECFTARVLQADSNEEDGHGIILDRTGTVGDEGAAGLA